MAERKFQPGFRLSVLDVGVLIVGGIGAWFVMSLDRWIGVAIVFVVLHFFLFCNVLRMSRRLELIWAGVFVVLAIAAISWDVLSWPVVFGISSVMTVLVAVVEMRRPSYHGVGWRKLNPRLLEWWNSVKG